MKIKFQYMRWLLPVVFFSACQKDNYTPPSSRLTGAILYQGDTIRVASQQVNFELWQPGFGKLTAISVAVDQNGTFSALLFDGNYKLDFPSGQGPFMANQINPKDQSDTLDLQVAGNTSLDIEVMPYYMIRDAQFSMSGGNVASTCGLEKIITDVNAKDIESVTLYLNKTYFADNNNNIATASVAGGDITDMGHITLQAAVPDLVPAQDYIFARIGVKIKDVEDMLYSQTEKIPLK